MKILFFLSEFPKLSETFILNQLVGLIEKGHEISIIAKKKENSKKIHEDIIKYNLQDKVIYYGTESHNSKIKKVSLYLLNLVKILLNKNNWSKISLKDLIKHKDLVFLISKLKKNNMRYDVISAHFGPNGLFAHKLIKLGFLEGKLYTTFHGFDMVRYVKEHGKDVYNELFEADNILLPISEYWKNKLLVLGANKSNIIVHHMGIDISKFKFSPITPNYGQEINILSVARLVEKKGIFYGVKAVTNLIKNGYNIRYTIIGDGPLREELYDFISNAQLEDKIKIVGWKTQEEVIKYIESYHIILLPSVTAKDGDMEGIPVLLMEAMAMGKIVISTFHSGIPELVKNKVNGYLVKERDSLELEKTIKGVISSTENWSEIQYKARQTVSSEFNIDLLNDRLESMFKQN